MEPGWRKNFNCEPISSTENQNLSFTNERKNERMNGRTDGRTDERTHARTNERTNERMNNFITVSKILAYCKQ